MFFIAIRAAKVVKKKDDQSLKKGFTANTLYEINLLEKGEPR
jgi:hypothetical protein